MSRESMFHRVRAALGRGAGAPAPVPPPSRLRPSVLSEHDRLELFREKLIQLSAQPYFAQDPADARAKVESILGGRPAVASNEAFLRECGITGIPGVQTDFLELDLLRQACAEAPFGITSAQHALAESGTLVMFSSQQQARMISLLPPEHIVVLARERVLDDLDQLLAAVPTPSERSSSMVFISGPSRTGDIELVLVRGVHGPRELHVIVV